MNRKQIVFDKKLVDLARELFYRVYVDIETDAEVIGSETSYTGDRIRIYATGWDYEEGVVIRNNDQLADYMEEAKKNIYDGMEFLLDEIA